jgi:hypothetical protein
MALGMQGLLPKNLKRMYKKKIVIIFLSVCDESSITVQMEIYVLHNSPIISTRIPGISRYIHVWCTFQA